MRVAFLSQHNPLDQNSFSGTVFYMRRALAERAEVTLLAERIHRGAGRSLVAKVRKTFGKRMFGIKDVDRRRRVAAIAAASEAELRRDGFDMAISVVSSDLLASLGDGIATPLIHVSDATPQYIAEEYGTPLRPEAYARERRAIERSAAVIYSSHFMAERAIAEFGEGIAPKVRIAPFGLNMDVMAEPAFETPPEGIRLVFIGKKWARKGGDIALDCLRWLRAAGAPAFLTILGSRPPGWSPDAPPEEGVTVIPFLDKNRPEEYARFVEILRGAHFLILPTRADCTPMVIAEANALGAPALATEVGGLRTLIEPGVNGWLFGLGEGGEAFGRKVLDILADPQAYQALRRSSHEWYQARLNWDAWSRSVLSILAEVADPAASCRSV